MKVIKCKWCSCLINNRAKCQTCEKNHNASTIENGVCDDCAKRIRNIKPRCVACGRLLAMTNYRFKMQGNYCKQCCKKAEEIYKTL